jgi:hypothetical protein
MSREIGISILLSAVTSDKTPEGVLTVAELARKILGLQYNKKSVQEATILVGLAFLFCYSRIWGIYLRIRGAVPFSKINPHFSHFLFLQMFHHFPYRTWGKQLAGPSHGRGFLSYIRRNLSYPFAIRVCIPVCCT